jgi:hypothetical protein
MPTHETETMKFHLLKTDPDPFYQVWLGTKTAEIRYNDRDFGVGDILELRLHDRQYGRFTGHWIKAVVTHILERGYGLEEDYIMLSFRKIGQGFSESKARYVS